jgi:hypothetical protein
MILNFFLKKDKWLLIVLSFVVLLVSSIYSLNQHHYSEQPILNLIEDPFFLEIFVIPTFLIYFSVSVYKLYNEYIKIRLIGIKKIKYITKISLLYTSVFFLMYIIVIFVSYVYCNIFIVPVKFPVLNFTFLNQFCFFFICSIVLFILTIKFKYSLILLLFLPIIDYFLLFSRLGIFLGVVKGPNSDIFFFRNILMIVTLFIINRDINYSLLKRELIWRLRYMKFFSFFLICLIIFFLIKVNNFGSFSSLSIYINTYLKGVSFSDINEIRNNAFFLIPFMWIAFQMLYLFMLSSYRYDDFYKSGIYVLIRCGYTKFNRYKNFSLFVSTMLFVFIFYILPIMVFTQITNINADILNINFPLYFIIVLVNTFLLGLIYEYGSLLFNPMLSLMCSCMIVIFSIFSKKITFLGSSMLSHWIAEDYSEIYILVSTLITVLIINFFIFYTKKILK